ncbi:SNF7 family protein [Acaryochloris sp. CCMEE 5410]|uniref:SNF7 family protein n=1 Tax=Acaryochloris sp. CCMEE 5410 TaxID=310037 RepID=UPI0021D371CF|nr:SNF7 family protein [Acaryochloris sp. CCMEE 5410]
MKEADQQITTLETQVKILKRQGRAGKAMKMARDVVSHFEQQVEKLTQEKQQLEQQFQMSASDDPVATVPAVVPESQLASPRGTKFCYHWQTGPAQL